MRNLYREFILIENPWLESSPCMQNVGCSNPGCYSPKSLKQVINSTLPTSRQRCIRHASSWMTLKKDAPCHSRCDTLKIPHCSMALSAEHDKFAVLHRLWRSLHFSKKNLGWDEKPSTTKHYRRHHCRWRAANFD